MTVSASGDKIEVKQASSPIHVNMGRLNFGRLGEDWRHQPAVLEFNATCPGAFTSTQEYRKIRVSRLVLVSHAQAHLLRLAQQLAPGYAD
jgi:hypothetical protein